VNIPVALKEVAPANDNPARRYRRRCASLYPANVKHAYKGSVYGDTNTAGVGASRYSRVDMIAIRRSSIDSVNLDNSASD
jgi:hypothetical protein